MNHRLDTFFKPYALFFIRAVIFPTVVFGTGPLSPEGRAEGLETPPFEFSTRGALDGWMVLGPFDETSDEITQNDLSGVFGSPGSPAVDTERLVWRDERPFRWISARTNSSGFLEVQSLFGPAKLGAGGLTAKAGDKEGAKGARVLYLYREVKVARDTRASLALAGGGGTAAWLNAEPLGVAFGEMESGTMSSQGSAGPIEGLTLRRGLNHLVVKTRVPSVRTPWVVYARFLEPGAKASLPVSPNLQVPFRPSYSGEKGDLPGGWRRMTAALSDKKAKPVSYALYLPAKPAAEGEEKPAPRPLTIVAPPSQTDEFHVLLYEPALVAEAKRAGWALAVPDLTGAAMREVAFQRALEAVREDAAKLPEIDPERACLVALGDAAEPALARAFERSDRYAGVASIEGRWGRPYSWPLLLLGIAPRPAVFVALPKGERTDSPNAAYPFHDLEQDMEPDDGPWVRREIEAGKRDVVYRDMFATFENNPIRRNPNRVAITGHVSSPEDLSDRKTPLEGKKRAWLCLKQSRGWARPAFLSVDRATPGSFAVQAENVSRFVLFFEDRDGSAPAPHVVLRIEYDEGSQKMNLVGLRPPTAVEFSLIRGDNSIAQWEAREWKAKPVKNTESPIAHFYEDLPVRGDEERGGMEMLTARAVRRVSGARVGLVPAGEVHDGGRKGGIVMSDAVGLTLDSRLSTVSVPLSHLLEILERDYAGAGILVTDGLGAVVGRDDRSVPGVVSPAGEGKAESSASEGVFSAFDPYRLGAKGGEPIFLATSFDRVSSPTVSAKKSGNPPVVLAGWSPLLERIASEGLAKQSKNLKDGSDGVGDEGGAYQIHYLPFGQREALLSYMSGEGIIESFPPDIRLLPRKRAIQMKKVRTIK